MEGAPQKSTKSVFQPGTPVDQIVFILSRVLLNDLGRVVEQPFLTCSLLVSAHCLNWEIRAIANFCHCHLHQGVSDRLPHCGHQPLQPFLNLGRILKALLSFLALLTWPSQRQALKNATSSPSLAVIATAVMLLQRKGNGGNIKEEITNLVASSILIFAMESKSFVRCLATSIGWFPWWRFRMIIQPIIKLSHHLRACQGGLRMMQSKTWKN